MKKLLLIVGMTLAALTQSLTIYAQDDKPKKDTIPNGWRFGGGFGFDFAQLLLINPKVGAGENRLGFGGNISFFAKYKKDRLTWDNAASTNFGVQKLGRGFNRPFQKSIDELRAGSSFAYAITKDNPFAYAADFTLLSQLTPTYEGNFLSPVDGINITHAISDFLSPSTMKLSLGMAYKPQKGNLQGLSVMVSPLSAKMISVANDSIARLGNEDGTASLHGNPYGRYDSVDDFEDEWGIRPAGIVSDSVYYAKADLQLGASIRLNYANKFFTDEKGKNARLAFSTSLTLYSNYRRNPQFIDVEWLTTTDIFIIKGLSISIGTNLFYDHDVLVQIDADNDILTGVNGYETTGRRVSFTQTLLIKYNFLF